MEDFDQQNKHISIKGKKNKIYERLNKSTNDSNVDCCVIRNERKKETQIKRIAT